MAFGRKRTKLNSLHYFERKALLYQFFCHHVKDAQSIDKFCWVSKWHRTNNVRTIIFWTGVGGGGGVENFNMQTFFFHKQLAAANNFFVCLRLPANTFFKCIQFISVFTASANNLFQNFPTLPPRPPPSKNNGPSLMAKKKKNYCAK